jgi:hypothetical protein
MVHGSKVQDRLGSVQPKNTDPQIPYSYYIITNPQWIEQTCTFQSRAGCEERGLTCEQSLGYGVL